MDKKNLVKNLRKFKKKIKKKHRIKKVILFGSRAGDKNIREESDVDLIIVGDFKGKKNFDRSPNLYHEWDIDLPVDFLCYTPEEFNKLKKMVTIVQEAVRTGIVIK